MTIDILLRYLVAAGRSWGAEMIGNVRAFPTCKYRCFVGQEAASEVVELLLPTWADGKGKSNTRYQIRVLGYLPTWLPI